MGVKDLLFEDSESGHDLPFCEKTTLIIHYFHHHFMISMSEIDLLRRMLNKSPQKASQKKNEKRKE